jgi:hypothetical protein
LAMAGRPSAAASARWRSFIFFSSVRYFSGTTLMPGFDGAAWRLRA